MHGVCTLEPCGVAELTLGSAEYQMAGNDRGRVIRYKFAFRWCEGQVGHHCQRTLNVTKLFKRTVKGEPWWLDETQSTARGTSVEKETPETPVPGQLDPRSSFSSNKIGQSTFPRPGIDAHPMPSQESAKNPTYPEFV